MSELIELAERCERAMGPDRYINLAIANAIYGDKLAPSGTDYNYTGSLDAAITLVPEGMLFIFFGDGEAAVYPVEGWRAHIPNSRAATPALALCAAALKACAHD